MKDLLVETAIHKSYLNRLLIEIADHPLLSQVLAFKGGTCAAMLGALDRFSIDLDFDLVGKGSDAILRRELRKITATLGLTIKKEFSHVLLFQIQYPGLASSRNTLKLSINTLKVKANEYQIQFFPEIDRFLNAQTVETMFANKLVAVTDRWRRHHSLAGRDLYDLHHFFVSGYDYSPTVIKERTNMSPAKYLLSLRSFVKNHFTQQLIDEDLNPLLSASQFRATRKILLPETLHFLKQSPTLP